MTIELVLSIANVVLGIVHIIIMSHLKLPKLKEEMGKLAAYEKQMLASPGSSVTR